MSNSEKLAGIIDILLNQRVVSEDQVKTSANSFFTYILPAYAKKDLNKHSDQNDIDMVLKIFQVITRLYLEHPRAIEKSNHHILIIESLIPFFNRINFPLEIVEQASLCIMPIISAYSQMGDLKVQRYLSQQRKILFKLLDSSLTKILQSFTNSNQKITEYDSLLKFDMVNKQKITQLSISIRILSILFHPSTYNVLATHLASNISLESYLTKCWFCLKSVVVNDSLSLEDTETVELYDELYAKLLQLTTDYYYDDDTPNFAQLQLITSQCRQLLNWPLFSTFPSTHIVLSQSLLKIAIKLSKSNNLPYFWSNIKLTTDKKEYIMSLLNRKLHIDLKTSISFLYSCHLRLSGLPVIDKKLLTSINRKYEFKHSNFLRSRCEAMIFPSDVSQLESYNDFNYTTSVNEYINYWKTSENLSDPIFRIRILNTMIKLSCYLSGNLINKTLVCKVCDNKSNCNLNKLSFKSRASMKSNKEMWDIYNFFLNEFVSKVGQFDDSDGNLTISIINTLKHFFTNFRNPQLDGALWNFIQNCFTNVFREVRLLIVNVLPLAINCTEDAQYDDDLQQILLFIKGIVPNESNSHLFEGLLILLGELLSIKSIDTSYHFILTRITDFLSDTDEFRVDLAIIQLRNVASAKGITPWKVIEPFISPISIKVMENITTKPSLLNNLCVSLDMPEWLFIEKTNTYTVPVLFHKMKNAALNIMVGKIKKNKNQTKIQKINDLINHEIISVVAHSLVVTPKNAKNKLMKLLLANEVVSAEMDFGDLMESLSPQLPLLIFKILLFYSKADSDRIKRIINAVGEIADTLNYEGSSKAEATSAMNDRWLLTIVQLIFTTISDVKGSQPFLLKLYSMRALVCLSELCPSFETCLNQIMNGLQVAIQYPELQKEAILCWEHLFDKFTNQGKRYVIDPIVCQFFIKWPTLSLKIQTFAGSLISQLHQWCSSQESTEVKYWFSTYTSAINKIPSLKALQIPVCRRIDVIYNSRKKLKSDNHWVVENSLDILIDVLSTNQRDIQSELFKMKNSQRMRLFLMDISQYITDGGLLTFKEIRYSGLSNIDTAGEAGTRISYKSAQVLSLIGNIEMNSTNGSSFFTKRHPNGHAHFGIDNVNNFLLVTTLSPIENSEQELTLNNLQVYFVQNVLVRLLITSINPDQQKLLACTIHDYMQLCDVLTLKTNTEKIEPLTGNILSSLKTEMASWKKKRLPNLSFPIYEEYKDHKDWIQRVSAIVLYNTDDLFKKLGMLSETASNILNNIPYLDITVSKFVLPYVILAVITHSSSSSEFIQLLFNEFQSILDQKKDEIYYEYVRQEWKKCVRTILDILQFLKAWLNKGLNDNKQLHQETFTSRVERFLERFDSLLLAKRSAECGSFEGAVFFLEKGFKNNQITESTFSNELKDMYVGLEDFDQLQGVLKVFSNNNLNDMLLKFKYNEDQTLSNQSLTAIAQFDFDENTTSDELMKNKSVTELLDGLDRNCEYDQLLLNLKNFERTIPGNSHESINADWSLYGLQASIFTGDINELKKWTSISENFNSISIPGSDLSIYYQIARALVTFNESETIKSQNHIDKAIKYIGLVILNFAKSTNGMLPKYLTLLHGLYDFKLLATSMRKDDSVTAILRQRQQNSSKEFRFIWKIHSLRASIYKLHPLKEFQNVYQKSLIGGSRILRENSRLPQATKLLTKALILNEQTTDETVGTEFSLLISVEFSKLLWEQGDYQSALKKMSKVIETIDKTNANYLSFQLTYLKWLVDSAEGSSDVIRNEYSTLTKSQAFNTESDVYYQYGNYLSKLLDAQKVEDATGELDIATVRMYMIAIGFSDPTKEYIYEVFPKAITIWLDFYDKYNLSGQVQDSSRFQFHSKLNELIKTAIEGTEIGVKWYIVLSQVISRILHPSTTVVKNIQRIVILLCKSYPSVILYSVFSLANSVMNKRQQAAINIMQQLKAIDTSQAVGFKHSKAVPFVGLITKSYDLITKMARICSIQLKDKKRKPVDLYKDLKFDPQNEGNCPYLALPVKYNFDQLYKMNDSCDFITFNKFEKKVIILSSLQCPKRVEIVGSDGRRYLLLMKPNDDLRKDHKVMEFSNVMNNILKKDHETQKRNMRIQSYAATPLSEKIGIIEWVQNFKTLRPIITKKLPRFMQLTKDFNEYSKDCKTDSERVKLFQEFKNKSLPVLSDWMIEVAPNVIHWYDFRAQYCSSLAVMSIVGYLVGIGDRHLDNIMVSERNGNIMHIDFDCIFEKGKSLAVPEVVPFRLTRNMVDGLGVLKWEGRFRKISELTMSRMRQNEVMLMNFLESFIYDPLLDWTKKTKDPSVQRNEVYSRLRKKIKGILTPDDPWTMYMDTSGLCVSVNLQVDLLIQAATNDSHLAVMFYGWCPLA